MKRSHYSLLPLFSLLPLMLCLFTGCKEQTRSGPAAPNVITQEEVGPAVESLLRTCTFGGDDVGCAFADWQLSGVWYRIAMPEAHLAALSPELAAGAITAWSSTETTAQASLPLLAAAQNGGSPIPLNLTLALSFEKKDGVISITDASLQIPRGSVAAQPENLTFIDPALDLVFRLPLHCKDDLVWGIATPSDIAYGQLALGLSVPLAPYSKMAPATLLTLYAHPKPMPADELEAVRPFNILGENEEWTFALYFPTDVQWDPAVPETKTLYDEAVGHIPALMEAFAEENQVALREDFHSDYNWNR